VRKPWLTRGKSGARCKSEIKTVGFIVLFFEEGEREALSLEEGEG
jgi:hypothetical protein